MKTYYHNLINFKHGKQKYFWLLGTSRSGHTFIKHFIESWFEYPYYYVNLENYDPERFIKEHKPLVSNRIYEDSLKIICVRDLLNTFVSRFYCPVVKRKLWTHLKVENLRWESEKLKDPSLEFQSNIQFIPDGMDKEDFLRFWQGPELSIEEKISYVLDAWLRIAKEFFKETNFLEGSVSLYYDEFFVSQSYRKEICNKVGGEYTEKMLNFVPSGGNHSSFQKDFQGKGQELGVLERYKMWDGDNPDKKYLKELKDHEALEFYLNNFDVDDDKRRFIDKWIILT